MFSINFTKAQAEQYIKERLCGNFINVPEFTVNISVSISDVESTKEATEESLGNTLEVNPWLIPDEDGWFTHNPEWKSEECPPYITKDRKVVVILSDRVKESYLIMQILGFGLLIMILVLLLDGNTLNKNN